MQCEVASTVPVGPTRSSVAQSKAELGDLELGRSVVVRFDDVRDIASRNHGVRSERLIEELMRLSDVSFRTLRRVAGPRASSQFGEFGVGLARMAS